MTSTSYYKSFPYYRIEKKITVEDHAKIKDYAKRGIYFYVIHENVDNNRFIFVSSKHYEEETKIPSHQFKLQKITGDKETVLLKERRNNFGELFFRVTKEEKNAHHKILFKQIITSKKDFGFFSKYKCHWKKLAMDNPSWYLEILKKTNKISYHKQAMQLLLCKNKYNDEHIKHAISTFFIFKDSKFQMFNDHAIIMDEGKTGKSSMISYMGEKVDNVSIAGLYGSSDGLRGKFKGGLVTTTKKAIIIDEINEMISNNKGEKVLSILNTPLENGVYNYQKQFSQKLYISNQFMFLANIKENCNFPLLLEHSFGNVATFGRRIGIITYDNNLNGFSAGDLRDLIPPTYLIALQEYCSSLLNYWFSNPKNIQRLYGKRKYKQLCQFYLSELSKIERQVEEETTRAFIKSHKKSIVRAFTRAFKLYVWENLDKFIEGKKFFNNHTHSEVLDICENVLKQNIISFKNILEEVQNNNIVDRLEERNALKFNALPSYYQKILMLFNENKEKLNQSGTKYEYLKEKNHLRKYFGKWKSQKKIPNNLKRTLLEFGCHIQYCSKENSIKLRFISKDLFEKKTRGIFDNSLEIDLDKSKGTSQKNEKTNIQEIAIEDLI